ncbi:hypothetical protein [Companilactobacillus baiquanensis]|uniref:Uncharacterized protein n=1 Tax=Companilactobacillus baiquanensis TaxID=2486005 RepID=A0ABW1UTA1_9LACO|nr:hypothetical protein [Companilactobacillus baiquanensis]
MDKIDENFYLNVDDEALKQKVISDLFEWQANIPAQLERTLKKRHIEDKIVWKGAIIGHTKDEKYYGKRSVLMFYFNNYYVMNVWADVSDPIKFYMDEFKVKPNIAIFGYGFLEDRNVTFTEDNPVEIAYSIDKFCVGDGIGDPAEIYDVISDLINKRKDEVNKEVEKAINKRDEDYGASKIDSRFRNVKDIVSQGPIPKGFKYQAPKIYITSEGIDDCKKAYKDCLAQAYADMNSGKYDALFNVKVISQPVAENGICSMYLTGDAVNICN